MVIIWENIVLSVISFAILYWLLSRYAFKPLFGIMEKRKQMVLAEIEQAEQDRKNAAIFLEEQRKAAEQAREESKEIMEQTRKISSKSAEEIIEAAKAEAQRLKQSAIEEIANEKNQAIEELRNQVGEISIKIASKIIEKEVDPSAQGQLVDKYLKEVEGQ